VQQLRLKSPTQLEEYHKKRQELQSLQRTAEADREDNERALLNTQLRTTRTQLPPRQEPYIVVPPRFAFQANAVTPFANPTTLNAFFAMNTVLGHNNTGTQQHAMNAPFRMQLPNLPATPLARPVRKVFRSKMYCWNHMWMEKERTFTG
jgi:hypothetical protein